MTYDICAYTNKVYTTSCSNEDYLSLYTALSSALIKGGWTYLADNDFISQKCPWLDGATPDYYKGQVRIKLGKLVNDLTIQAGNVDFTVSHNDIHILKSRATEWRIVEGTYTIIVNPYQLIIFLTEEPISGFTQYGVLISSLQVPKFVGTKLQVIDSIISIPINNFKTRLSHIGEQDNFFLHFNSVIGGSFSRHSESGNHVGSFGILHYTLAGMDEYMYGDPIISPPFMCWNLSSEYNKATINGFMWDAIVINESFPSNERLSIDGHNWLVYTKNSNKSSLAFVTGGLS